MSNDKCVYLHKDTNDVVRYVGSGSIRRAGITCAKSDRGIKYKNFVESNGKLVVQIIEEGLTKQQARELEIQTYFIYVGHGNLLNSKQPSAIKDDLSKLEVEQFLYYDESSPSCLRWKTQKVNRIKKDGVAGGVDSRGYYNVSLNGSHYKAHRIVLILHDIPISSDDVVDHIDGNPKNNRVHNLRVVDQATNMRNRMKHANNSTGKTGVSYSKSKDTFVAFVKDPVTYKIIRKSFSCKKYGYDKAFQLACSARDYLFKAINEQMCLKYTNRHLTEVCNVD